MSRRRVIAAAIAAATAVALGITGCSASGTGSSNGKVTLNYWITQQQGPSETGLRSMVKDFEKANPNITVNVTEKSTDNLKTALRQAAGTPAMPDVYFQWSGLGLGGTYVKQGVDLDLTKYYKKYGWIKDFTKTALASVTQYGGYHGVPYTADVEGIVYNKALFKQAGITTTPTTYDELVADAAKLKSAGITPIEFGGSVNWYVMRLLDNLLETKCGSAQFDKLTALKADWSKASCVTSAFTGLHTWATQYFNSGWVSMTDAQGQQVFYQKKAAMALEGDWFGGFLKQAHFSPTSDLGVFAFPTGTGRVYGLQQANYISKTSKNPDAAAKFLDYWMSKSVQTKYAGDFSQIPVVNDVSVKDSGVGLTDSFNQLAKDAKGQFQNNDQTLPLDVTTEYWRIMNGVATGSIPATKAGSEMRTFIKNRSGS
ncbi:carbohydrate ABC transporter substrate-binding protein [Curtobacterium sp. MCBD17_034]|uniref:ABC transporter substrate-binding protein n=1 Tax=unclassified Curtobacterium TaxID=257496 RepID=UPI000DA9E86B|nr:MULTISPECIES: extracellular solute-binding protein [unclassified Curtobacterium]PZF56182.1 carbohydrate ABC transporter substrate-binding protein [Curtobacterium sp. MCBD17_034]PZM32953.1 carbohydrate ABC transporter substrate-binding protein [Curtobacterium sp. MCBD17_031]